jgi:hypothetical protein
MVYLLIPQAFSPYNGRYIGHMFQLLQRVNAYEQQTTPLGHDDDDVRVPI